MIRKNKEELGRIHNTRTAIPGELYEDEKGVLYTGTVEGFLKREINLKGDTQGTSLNNTIEQIGPYSTQELINKLDTINNKVDTIKFEQYKKEAKCFTIAMAIAL